MSSFVEEKVVSVHHWNDTLFSIKTTRRQGLRFSSGHFLMIGLEVEGKPLMRAYSVASASYDDHLEFLSIKVSDGPLTSRLRHVNVGDALLISSKAVGTLVLDDLRPGKHLYLFCTGTGLAPFMSIIRDPQTYDRFEQVVLVHGVRYKSELAYGKYIHSELPRHELLGEQVSQQLRYVPIVSREPFVRMGRITHYIEQGELANELQLPELNPQTDRAMICGSPDMLADLCDILNRRGMQISPCQGEQGDYVIERAFVDR
jgi:ferredoxin--NADP+ reductase